MFIVIWKYDVMEGKSRQDLIDAAKADAQDYLGVPGLIQKAYGISPDHKSVSEIYLWKTKGDADRFFDREWDGAAGRRWESALMTRQDLEVPVIADSESKRLVSG
ncbi:MAG: YdhR family protein [Betaproteobacteria bacterium]|jgi:hypothetical protein|nr:YdhR family protein [Betaproteobacteria bacterium]